MQSFSQLQLRAERYAHQYDLRLDALLGSGKDGTVWKTNARSALKVFVDKSPYRRELAVYRRLREREVSTLCGHAVPELLESSDSCLAFEMSIVRPPYVLDFASAGLDGEAVEFPPEVLADHHEQLREWFGERLPKVAAIMAALKGLGIHMTDIHPRNIAFENPGEDE